MSSSTKKVSASSSFSFASTSTSLFSKVILILTSLFCVVISIFLNSYLSQHGLEEVTRFYDIRVDSKDHLISEMSKLHPTSRWTQLSNIWTEEELKRIRSVVMNGVSSYRSFISDVTSDIEDIGESEPLQVVTAVDEKTGKVRESYRCDNSLLVPNGSKTKCILPARLDVGYHHLVTGGINAWREGADRLISRMLSFSHIFHSLDNTLNQELPEFKQLFESPEYLEGALEICEGKNVLDPIQLSIVIQLPGQEVPAHYDAPWFKGATRFTLPQWLLTVMDQSNLFVESRVQQVQGVAYLHQWKDALPEDSSTSSSSPSPSSSSSCKYSNSTNKTKNTCDNTNTLKRDGGFYFDPWFNGDVIIAPPDSNTGIILDGSVVPHGTIPYLGQNYEDKQPLLRINKDDKTILKRIGEDRWAVKVVEDLADDTNGQIVREYSTDELRIALVWRARCFSSTEEIEEYKVSQLPENRMKLQTVMDTLLEDMVQNKKVYKNMKEAQRMLKEHPFEVAMKMNEVYVKYPIRPGQGLSLPTGSVSLPKSIDSFFSSFSSTFSDSKSRTKQQKQKGLFLPFSFNYCVAEKSLSSLLHTNTQVVFEALGCRF